MRQTDRMRCAAGTLAFSALFLLAGCGGGQPAPTPTPPKPPDLAAQSELFRKGVEKVADGIYVAIGFGLANSILIEGDDGVIVVDTLEGRPQAEAVKAAFDGITSKPVKAVILTHNHADHVFGGAVFTGGDPNVPVIAHESTASHIDRIINVVRDDIYVRSMRMFGQLLPPVDEANSGIGMRLDYRPENIALARPTQTFSDTLDITIAGVRFHLVHAPGETPDQIVVWLPDKKVLLPADNVYQAFPNLYTIRGTSYRDVMEWVDSIDRMRDFDAEFLVPSHTRPVAGKEAVADVLTAYRDAIQYVHDQTVRGLNQGKTPDELVATVKLPANLANHPWLGQYYGTVAWSVRGIYDGYLGWFNGDATTLNPSEPTERARKLADALALGKPISEQAKSALAAKDYQWAAELAREWTRVEPDSVEARDTLADCFRALGAAQSNANARNYYLTQALEWRGDLEVEPNDPSSVPDSFIDELPIDGFMRGLAVRLNPEAAKDANTLVQFSFTDIATDYTVHVRNCVAEVRKRTVANPAMKITTTAKTWKRIASKKTNPAGAYASGEIQVDGGVANVIAFLRYFER
ncbi:MAG: MBL fold metallo-hydrolase [Candidatus Hydrogenedentes bacterium]|nr:MBL fold metallo-hydrolase [Candidatus Hydrogenedentota bacterium]